MKILKIKILKSIFVFSVLNPFSWMFAQRSIVDMGVEGGMGISSLHGNESVEYYYHSKSGPTGGAFIQYSLKKIFSFRLGGYYQNKGASLKTDLTDASGNKLGTASITNNFNYITIPLLLRASFGSNAKVFVNAGPYIDFLLKQTENIKGTGVQRSSYSDNTTDYKKTDAGVSFGIGVSYPVLHQLSVSLEIRDYLGLTNVCKIPLYNNGSIKNNSLNCLLGVTYRFIDKS